MPSGRKARRRPIGPGAVAVGASRFLAPGHPDRHPSGRPGDGSPFASVELRLTEMAWFRDVLRAHPLLGRYRPQVEVVRPADDVGLSRERLGPPTSVPDRLRFGGYDVRPVTGGSSAAPQTFVLRPADPTAGFKLQFTEREAAAAGQAAAYTVFLTASYLPDPEVEIVAAFDADALHELVANLPALVARLREIVACLDVTAAPPASPKAALAALAALLAANPSLTGGEARRSS